MRDLESIDDELALTAEVREALRDDGWSFPTWQVDGLLDERLRFVSARALLGCAHLVLRRVRRQPVATPALGADVA